MKKKKRLLWQKTKTHCRLKTDKQKTDSAYTELDLIIWESKGECLSWLVRHRQNKENVSRCRYTVSAMQSGAAQRCITIKAERGRAATDRRGALEGSSVRWRQGRLRHRSAECCWRHCKQRPGGGSSAVKPLLFTNRWEPLTSATPLCWANM